jgi:hypothetical protein
MESKRKPYKLKYGHKLRRVFASLDDGSIAKAKELGNGNLSKGVRAALSLAQVPGSEPARIQDALPHDGEQPPI